MKLVPSVHSYNQQQLLPCVEDHTIGEQLKQQYYLVIVQTHKEGTKETGLRTNIFATHSHEIRKFGLAFTS